MSAVREMGRVRGNEVENMSLVIERNPIST
jgi:hypothetical protein